MSNKPLGRAASLLEERTDKAPKVPKTMVEKESTGRVIVILERCCLESVKVGKEFQLMNADDHKGFLKKNNRPIEDARPDITHQCLMTLLDSPLNKAGRLQIFLRTQRNVLIEVNPHLRVPRTFSRFCGLFVQLLHKLSIRASNGPDKLLKVIKNPVTDHLPTNCRKILFSYSAERAVNINKFSKQFGQNENVVFIIGGMAHGCVDVDYSEETIAISDYPLSGSVACGKLCCAFEELYGIL